jgi:hypothetical protein
MKIISCNQTGSQVFAGVYENFDQRVYPRHELSLYAFVSTDFKKHAVLKWVQTCNQHLYCRKLVILAPGNGLRDGCSSEPHPKE